MSLALGSPYGSLKGLTFQGVAGVRIEKVRLTPYPLLLKTRAFNLNLFSVLSFRVHRI